MQTSLSQMISSQPTVIEMQTRLSGLGAIQNFQEYLKYLIMTVSIEPQKPLQDSVTETQALPIMVKQESLATVSMEMEEEKPLSEKNTAESHAIDSPDDEAEQYLQRSQKLFSLMQNKFSISSESKRRSNQTVETTTRYFEAKSGLCWTSKKVQKKKNLICGHPEKEHFARGLCGSCYLKHGRNKRPWNCPHEKLYALGLCQKCYAVKYNMKKKITNPSVVKKRTSESQGSVEGSQGLHTIDFECKKDEDELVVKVEAK